MRAKKDSAKAKAKAPKTAKTAKTAKAKSAKAKSAKPETAKAKSAQPETAKARSAKTERKVPSATKKQGKRAPEQVVLLSGGNPRIAKGEGDAPVQAYITALPGWKRDLGERLDALIVRNVPNVHKAVKWNSPLYGIEGQGWFLGIHAFKRYLKVAFFRGTSLRPNPPGASKSADTRYLDLYEDEAFDEAQLARWVKQAAALPGWQL